MWSCGCSASCVRAERAGQHTHPDDSRVVRREQVDDGVARGEHGSDIRYSRQFHGVVDQVGRGPAGSHLRGGHHGIQQVRVAIADRPADGLEDGQRDVIRESGGQRDPDAATPQFEQGVLDAGQCDRRIVTVRLGQDHRGSARTRRRRRSGSGSSPPSCMRAPIAVTLSVPIHFWRSRIGDGRPGFLDRARQRDVHRTVVVDRRSGHVEGDQFNHGSQQTAQSRTNGEHSGNIRAFGLAAGRDARDSCLS